MFSNKLHTLYHRQIEHKAVTRTVIVISCMKHEYLTCLCSLCLWHARIPDYFFVKIFQTIAGDGLAFRSYIVYIGKCEPMLKKLHLKKQSAIVFKIDTGASRILAPERVSLICVVLHPCLLHAALRCKKLDATCTIEYVTSFVRPYQFVLSWPLSTQAVFSGRGSERGETGAGCGCGCGCGVRGAGW